jgi:hypothetical protein
MSRNAYVGANVVSLATARSEAEIEQKAKELYQTVDQTNFPLRAQALVREIKRTKPDIVGFQELSRFYRGPDGHDDGIKDATTPLYNFRKIMENDLRAAGLHYKTVSDQVWLDVEVSSADGYDGRLQQANTVMIRTGRGARVKFLRQRKGVVPAPARHPAVRPDRAPVVRLGGDGGQGRRQAVPVHRPTRRGLLRRRLDAAVQGPRSGASQDEEGADDHRGRLRLRPLLADAELVLGWLQGGARAGFKETSRRRNTCCQDEKLDNPQSKLKQWIDYIVVRPAARVLSTALVGDKLSDRIGGLWPSDHAGLVARLRLKR